MLKIMHQNLKVSVASMVIILCFSSFGTFKELKKEPLNTKLNMNTKTAIVTGSNRGMGLGWVKHFLKEGYTVIATTRKPEKASDLLALKKEYKKQLLIQKLDVTNEEDMLALGELLKKKKIKIDVAISNAGVTVEEKFGEWTSKSFLANYKVNTMGAAFFAQTISPFLAEGSKLVQLSSGHGAIGTHAKRMTGKIDAYGVSKAGVNMLTRKLSFIWQDRKIIVVSITPGGVKTDMNQYGKLSVSEAIPIMYKTIANLTIENSGTFINNTGKVMSW
ncbi:NAD(P)-dependent dehydrogenase (short-subunit alcohol dehydrogenase family) [Maribacter vaceletii]|uniref:NAD(P)-dependent dehydrogenase (Short-subunit alcohol dehydrogenase family) n=1 Tax=Maribacter vaceletii TaxID=1206816 RepID=A0A495DV19_9FLAO|nr:SDR family NAD(P)-dependent oxidoreductase [Maribacter vaceletii]RKR08039.1 NAD(P)-dependent dehydrogenase (short-subunit alcohol dehydrogenase family) [Maribacter vaceletii]